MKIKYISNVKVESLISFNEAYKLLKTALIKYSLKEVQQPVRSAIAVKNHDAIFYSMPSYSNPLNSLGIKVLTNFPHNKGDVPSHQGLILMYDATTGAPTAILDSEFITGLRTSIVSVIGSQLFAREDAQVMSIIGTGYEAECHLQAHFDWKRDWTCIYLIGRDFEKTRKVVEELNKKYKTTIIKAVCGDKNKSDALLQSDIICTVTSSTTPVLTNQMVKNGCHINAVGAPVPTSAEIDEASVMKAKVIVDSIQAALVEGGEIVQYKPEIVCEIGEYLADNSRFNIKRSDLTIFKHLGMSIEDVVIAKKVLENYKD